MLKWQRTENRDPRQLLLAGQRSMKKLLGWEPSTPLEAGLHAAAGYFRERLAGARHDERGAAARTQATRAAAETAKPTPKAIQSHPNIFQ